MSKGSPRAYELVTRLNQVFIEFQDSGYSDEVMRRFLPPTE